MAVAVVLLGTMYPLISDAFGLGKISVGPPYFNFFFVPLTFILLMFIPLAMRSSWGHVSVKILSSWLIQPFLLSFVVGLIGSSMLAHWVGETQNSFSALVTLMCVSWVFMMIFVDVKEKLKLSTFTKLPVRYYGMVLAHLGVAVTVLGAGLYASSGIQKDVKMGVGGEVVVGSLKRARESLLIEFHVSDDWHSVKVTYEGILPDLFSEGQSTVVTGKIDDQNILHAVRVLAKHDENYTPPEIAGMYEDRGT